MASRNRTTDHGTTRRRDDETTRRRDYGTTRLRDDETTGRRDDETTRRRDYGTTRLRDDETTGRRDDQTAARTKLKLERPINCREEAQKAQKITERRWMTDAGCQMAGGPLPAFHLDGLSKCWQSWDRSGQLSSVVEQLICNQQVVGSSPTAGSTFNRQCFQGVCDSPVDIKTPKMAISPRQNPDKNRLSYQNVAESRIQARIPH